MALVAAACFGLGYWIGQRDEGAAPPVAPASSAPVKPSAAPEPQGVQLAIDASAVTLLPDASLTLKPFDTLDAGLLSTGGGGEKPGSE